MTMYLDWDQKESMLDLGMFNSEYISGNWSNHNISFTNSVTPSASFSMSSFKFNDTEYLTSPAALVPMNENPNTIMFGLNYQSVYENFIAAFKEALSSYGWWCTYT